ncbi:unnamed protein product [Closterium sp. NIES-54]
MLIRWLLATKGTRGSRVRCLHFDRGVEFRSGVLAEFWGEQGIRQSWTLPESPQKNWVAVRRIGLAMDITHTSMIHARAPHFWWPYSLRYSAHQLNLQPRVSRLEGCLALVRDTSADKLSARAIPSVFLGFPVGSLDYSFYHPPLHQFLDSRDVRFDESVSYYTQYPYRGLPVPPPPLFLAPSPPPAPAPPVPPPPPLVLPHQSLQQPPALPRQVTVDSVGVGAGGAATGGTRSRGARLRGAGARVASAGGASFGCAGARGSGTGGASSRGTGAGGAGTGGASSGGAGAGGTGTGGASSGGAGAGGADTEETGAGGSPTALPTASPHRHDSRFQALRRLERKEQERVEQERQELQHCCPPRAQPSSPLVDLRTVLFCSPPRRTPPVSVLPSSPESSLTVSSHPIIDYYRAARHVVSRVLTSLVTEPCASRSSVSALIAAIADFVSTRRLDYATRVVAAPPPRPLSVWGESALGCDVIEDRQFELEFLATASPSLCAMLLSLEGDPDALDIPTPCTYREAHAIDNVHPEYHRKRPSEAGWAAQPDLFVKAALQESCGEVE